MKKLSIVEVKGNKETELFSNGIFHLTLAKHSIENMC